MTSETQVETVKVVGEHKSHVAGGRHWVTPVGWAPAKPAEFGDDEFIVSDGSVWGDAEEEAGIVYFGPIKEDEEKDVPLADLNWVRADPTYDNLGPVRVETAEEG